MLLPSLGGYMLKHTKDIIKKDIVVRSVWFRLIYYLQKKEDFWESFQTDSRTWLDRLV